VNRSEVAISGCRPRVRRATSTLLFDTEDRAESSWPRSPRSPTAWRSADVTVTVTQALLEPLARRRGVRSISGMPPRTTNSSRPPPGRHARAAEDLDDDACSRTKARRSYACPSSDPVPATCPWFYVLRAAFDVVITPTTC